MFLLKKRVPTDFYLSGDPYLGVRITITHLNTQDLPMTLSSTLSFPTQASYHHYRCPLGVGREPYNLRFSCLIEYISALWKIYLSWINSLTLLDCRELVIFFYLSSSFVTTTQELNRQYEWYVLQWNPKLQPQSLQGWKEPTNLGHFTPTVGMLSVTQLSHTIYLLSLKGISDFFLGITS